MSSLIQNDLNKVDAQQIDCGHTLVIKRTDGIVVLYCSDHAYDVEDIKQNHLAIKKLMGAQKAHVLTFASKYSSATNEARAYTSNGPHKDFIAAEAFVIHSLAQRLLASFYIKVSKPIVPAGYFTDSLKAEKWLQNFKTRGV